MSLGHYTGLDGAKDILDFAPPGWVRQSDWKQILLGNLPDLIMADGIQPVSVMSF